MQALLATVGNHGYLILFVFVFIETVGIPVPAALALLLAGGLSAKGPLQPGLALATAVSALLIGDCIMFLLGRYTGWWLLGILCRVSLNPEACILRSAQAFHRRGRTLLVVAKFVPGVNTLVPPMAGSMNMRFFEFLMLDCAGGLLYICAYFGAGFLFSGFLGLITNQYERLSTGLGWFFTFAVVAYIAFRLWLFLRARVLDPVSRLPAEEIARRLYSDSASDIALFDVRSHGYYDKGSLRIKGSVRLEPNSLLQAIESLPRGKDIVLYCTCIQDATSVRVARMLKKHGIRAWIIEGGLRSWTKAGLPLETVPEEDVVLLPTFS